MAYKLQLKRGLLSALPIGISGEPLFTTDTNDLYISNGTTNQKFQKFIASGTSSQFLKGDGSLDSTTYQPLLTNPVTGTGTTNYLPKWTSGSAIGNSQVFDNGTNVGIGTITPDGNLVVAAGTNGTASTGGYIGLTTGVNNSKVRGAAIETFTTDTSNNHGLRFYTNAGATTPSVRMTLDAIGNLGLGVTPSAWGAAGNLQVRAIGSQVDGWNVVNNAYDNAGWKYVSNGFANIYAQDAGRHIWYNAPSGTAGNAITFTQAMTLGTNSGLSIGTTTAAPSNGLLVAGAATFSSSVTAGGTISNNSSQNFIYASYDDVAALFQRVGTYGAVIRLGRKGVSNSTTIDYPADATFAVSSAGSECMRITSGGNLLVNSTTDNGNKLQVNGVADAQGFLVPNGGYYKAVRSSGALVIDLLGIEAGTDNTRLFITGDYNIKNGSGTTLMNMTALGVTTFSSSVTATSFIKSGGTSSQYLMADGSVTTGGGGGSVDELQVALICQVFG